MNAPPSREERADALAAICKAMDPADQAWLLNYVCGYSPEAVEAGIELLERLGGIVRAEAADRAAAAALERDIDSGTPTLIEDDEEPAASYKPDADATGWDAGPLPQALITLECGCSFTGPVASVKKVYCDTHGRHEAIASVTPYDAASPRPGDDTRSRSAHGDGQPVIDQRGTQSPRAAGAALARGAQPPQGGSIVSRIVARAWDDSPCPLTGRVIGQVDEEWVEVAWGDQQDADYPSTHREALDELRPVGAPQATTGLPPCVCAHPATAHHDDPDLRRARCTRRGCTCPDYEVPAGRELEVLPGGAA